MLVLVALMKSKKILFLLSVGLALMLGTFSISCIKSAPQHLGNNNNNNNKQPIRAVTKTQLGQPLLTIPGHPLLALLIVRWLHLHLEVW